jgi:hypothetical protein
LGTELDCALAAVRYAFEFDVIIESKEYNLEKTIWQSKEQLTKHCKCDKLETVREASELNIEKMEAMPGNETRKYNRFLSEQGRSPYLRLFHLKPRVTYLQHGFPLFQAGVR